MAGRVFLSLVVGLLCIQPAYAAGVFHVNAASTAPIPNGRSWDTAFRGIQPGVDAAFADGGGEVWVAGGTYTAAATPVVWMKAGVAFYGGFTGRETAREQRDWSANATVIDGENARQCVLGADNATLDGFTVTRGIGFQGGGMNNTQCSPLVANCLFAGNNTRTTCSGGGLYNSLASPVFTSCTFLGNSADMGGGAVYNSTSSPVFMNCVFKRNQAVDNGGAVYNVLNSAPILVNCVFAENTTSLGGGGGICSGSSSSPALMNCTFAGNSARFGGAVCSYTASVSLTNCLLWGDTAVSEPEIYSTSCTVTYSCVQGGALGRGNIKTDPLLVDGGKGGSLQIRAGSPCIDTGTATNAPRTDLIERARPQGSGIDMGAYEGGQGPGDMVTLTVQVSPPDGGRTTPAEGIHYYVRGETAWLEALPRHMRFVGWSGAVSGTGRQISAVMDTNKVLLASFTQNIIHVREKNGSGTQDGQSWATAFRDIQSGVDAASAEGGEVWVAGGVYTAIATEVLKLRPGTALYGGFAGTESAREQRDWSAHVTTIDGEKSRRCATGANDASIDGFTLKRGVGEGGGMRNTGASPEVTNCLFIDNLAPDGKYGGGMHNSNSSPVLMNCTFSGNTAGDGGGGMCNSYSLPRLLSCTFSANSAYIGGGMHNYRSSPVLTDCVVTSNSASSRGGGMHNSYCSPLFSGCIFSENTAPSGGGMHNEYSSSPTLTNCTFTANEAGIGGGIDNYYSCSPTLVNCTLAGNNASSGGDGMHSSSSFPKLANCIFWGDAEQLGPEIWSDSSSTLTATYSCIRGGAVGEGNLSLDPQFLQSSSGNFQLSPSSPCVDTGRTAGAPATDLLGNPRPQGNGIDMGAYESPHTHSVPVPDVAGRTQQEAVTLLEAEMLTTGTLSLAYSISVPSGSVIDQAPAAGTLVPPRSAVNLTVSQGPRPFAISYSVSPAGTGSVSGPATIFDTVGKATLTITPQAGYVLISLTATNGSITTPAPCVLSNVTAGTAVTATFGPKTNNIAYAASLPAGGSVAGPASVVTGETATVNVTVNPGYTLTSLRASNGSLTATAPYVLSGVVANTTVTAVFTANANRVTCVAEPKAFGSVTGPATLRTGESAVITLAPKAGYHIVDVAASNGTITATAPYVLSGMTEDTTITVSFAANLNSVACIANLSAGGSVTGPATIRTGDTAPLTVTANAGYRLGSLSVSNGSITAVAPYILSNVTENTTVTAIFVAKRNSVAYLANPVEGGSVSGPGTVDTGESAGVTVMPKQGYTLVSLTASNGTISASAPYVLSGVTENSTVTAIFSAISRTVAYAVSPPEGGSVTGPTTIDTGATATLSVTPQPGYHIDTVAATSGSITASAPYILSNLTADTTVTAVFSPNSNSVTYAASPPEGGSVAGPPTLLTGETATVTATPQAGYDLAGVTASNGNITATAPYVLSNVTASTTVTAAFAPLQQLVPVPDVSGQTQASAATAITGAGLVVGSVTQAHSAAVPAGGVIAQDPLAGVLVSSGSAVNFIVSQGPEPAEGEGEPVELVSVPNVSGMSAGQAETTLTGAGLTVSAVEESSPSVLAGQVIRQEPTAGAQVAAGTQVSLVVSSGPEDSGCGCVGCSGGKGAFKFDHVKKVFGDLFLGGLSLMAFLAFRSRRM